MWRKSSFSGDPNSNCVEVSLSDMSAAVRDSKNTDGPVLRFPAEAWKLLLTNRPG